MIPKDLLLRSQDVLSASLGRSHRGVSEHNRSYKQDPDPTNPT